MKRRQNTAVAALLGMLATTAAASAAAEAGAFAPRFFRSGQARRSIEVELEGNPGRFDAKNFPCSGCHGVSGEGRGEGGTLPADIRFEILTTRRQYDPASFCRALTRGEKPGGAPLARAMPRYRLEESECRELWHYLQRLEKEPPPGVSDREIVVAASLHQKSAARAAWLEALDQELQQINQSGGVYGRRFRLSTGNEPAAIRILVDGELPAPGEATDELLISVPPLRTSSTDWELWQVEAPREQQLALIAADAPAWRVLASPAGEEMAALFADAAADAGAKIDNAPGCGPGGSGPGGSGPDAVIALGPGPAELAELKRLDACKGERRFLLLEPALPLDAFASLRHPTFLVVPFDPGPERDPWASARRLARALIAACDRAGHKLRLPRLIEELSRAFAEAGGEKRALYRGIELLPLDEKASPRWLGTR